MEPGLKEGAFYDPVQLHLPGRRYIAEVEVDPETGVTEIVQFTAADDFGTLINPMIVEGQVHGGVAQGIGQAMLEQVVYDDDGQLVTGVLHGLRHAARRRRAVLHARAQHHRLSQQPAGHQGLRRGWRHRLTAGDHQRDHRCDRE